MNLKKKHIYLLSFFVPFLTMIVLMIYLGVAPFGDESFLIIDGLHQYMPFFSILYDKLHSGGGFFYTFRTGLGINFMSMLSYYLSSPMNLVIFFFSRNHLNMVVSWLIALKLSLSGLCAGIYFTSKSKKPGIHIVAIATAYALNGYMVGYCWNVMWLDAIMILPIILLGIERLIDKKDGRMYCIALFYALYCNYYIAFMICIFSVIWYLFYHFTSVKQFFFRGVVFAVYSVIAAGMAAFLLIPAYLGIKQTSSGETMFLPAHSWITGFWDLIKRQFDMAYPITHDNFDGNANLYFGVFTVLCLCLYLLNRKISIFDKIKKIILVVFFYLSFNEQILNFIWHGFHDQYGIPNRFAFLYGFVLLVMTFEVLEHIDDVRWIDPIISVAVALGILGCSYKYAETKAEPEVVASAAALLLVYAVIILLFTKEKKHEIIYRQLLPVVMAGEIIVSSFMGFDTNGQISISKFFYATDDMQKAITDLDDGTFYRSEIPESAIVDESTWYPMNAIALFGSTARSGMVSMMDSLGFHTGVNEYLYKGDNPVTDLMLDVKYQYFHENDSQFTNFNYVNTYGSMSVYENPVQNMSIGYAISSNIDNWYYDSDYPFRVLNDFCYQGYWIDGVFEDIPIDDPATNGCTAEATNDGEYFFDFQQKQADNMTFTLNIPNGADDLYVFYDGTQVENMQVVVDGVIEKDGDNSGTMLHIGKILAGSDVSITMQLKGEQTTGYVRLSAADFDQNQYDRLVQEMTSQSLNVTKMSDDHIEGSVDSIEKQYMFFSIPYDEGWQVKIDGKNVETSSIGNAFLSVIIPAGEHEIVLDYTPDGFHAGVMVSGVSLICFLLLCIVTVRRKKKISGVMEEEISRIMGETSEVMEEEASGIMGETSEITEEISEIIEGEEDETEYVEEFNKEDGSYHDGYDDDPHDDATDSAG